MSTTTLALDNSVSKSYISDSSATINGSGRFYHSELDVLRFFAFLAVFIHHGLYVFSPIVGRAGGFGLSFFFVLSAFLITELLQREKLTTGNIAIKDFYIRRAFRIWPLYYGFLLFSVILGVVFSSHHASWGFILSFIFMTGNIYIGRYDFPNSPAGFLWSISIEEQFYLFWPLLNLCCTRNVLLLITLCAFPLGSGVVVLLTMMHASANIGIWTNTLVQFQMFAFGVLLSLLIKSRIPRIGTAARLALLALGIALWYAAAAWTGVVSFGTQDMLSTLLGYYLVGFGCVAIFLSAYGMNSRIIPPPLVYWGKISYGLYVFHQLSLETASWILNRFPSTASSMHHARYGVLHLAVGLLFTFVSAILSYKYFETPFLRRKEAFSIIRSRSV